MLSSSASHLLCHPALHRLPGTASASQTSGSAWSGEWGGADKSFDKELLSRRDSLASLFTEGTFHDGVSGQQMDYSVYVPEVCLKKERCPLVLFMADASTVGKGVKAPLMQGWAALSGPRLKPRQRGRSLSLSHHSRDRKPQPGMIQRFHLKR